VNPEAHDAYLKGLSFQSRLTVANLDTAEQYYSFALSKDPKYALAFVGLAGVWGSRQQMGFLPPGVAVPRMKDAMTRALALDDGLAQAHTMFAEASTWTDWDWPTADREFRRSLDLDPNDGRARALYSHYLLIMKRPAEARAEIERARSLDPFNEMIQGFYGQYLLYTHQFDAAVPQFRAVLKNSPDSALSLGGLSHALHYSGNDAEALAAETRRWTARGDREMEAALGGGFADGGFRGAMARAGDVLAARSLERSVAPIGVSGFYLRAGQYDKAFDWLERSYEARDPNIPYIGVHPNYDAVHDDPRLQALARRLKLPI